MPVFWLGMLLALLIGVQLKLLPPSGYVQFTEDPVESIRLMILPSITLGLGIGAILARFFAVISARRVSPGLHSDRSSKGPVALGGALRPRNEERHDPCRDCPGPAIWQHHGWRRHNRGRIQYSRPRQHALDSHLTAGLLRHPIVDDDRAPDSHICQPCDGHYVRVPRPKDSVQIVRGKG